MIIVLTTFAYFVYILYQYFTNQIEPYFRNQSFITENTIEIDLNTDLVGYQFVYGTQPNFNKTYISFLAYYHLKIENNLTMIPLNIINFTNPSLEGFQCLDFSTLNNYQLTLNTKQNIQSALWIFTYRCIDQDTQKTSISDNCANETDIDNINNDKNSIIRLKLFTSQYNTSSQQMQANYRNTYINPVSTLQILTQIKSEKQVTSIKQGAIVQDQKSFSSPISYSQQDQPTDRVQSEEQVGVGSISSIFIYLDEIVQNTQIQFLALPQILASIYSVFTLLMFLGVFGRQISSSLLNNDLLHIFLKNIIYQIARDLTQPPIF
ncbi:transmembrane protein, putative (macronuclear) [Tetrahymena thermophila SB210]|uniref:Transmembrane protein, putative n=1 Tax=Tetrahymena thermophila (strain SB210) TaxID=312017 RepID=Q22LJ8_TETTS|nr:transmembrane protein, putative [Tetrahymena thermophila SB210]EAR86142.1 transmembrane protein, putative [Tetrahymena thermophila SB210]|eukprot:XP_976737.1 transmembrane protein, putative [Tetrahymena thermophila SB210]